MLLNNFSDLVNKIPIQAIVHLATTVHHPSGKVVPLQLSETSDSIVPPAFEKPEQRPKIGPSVDLSLDRARSPSEVILGALTAFTQAVNCIRAEV